MTKRFAKNFAQRGQLYWLAQCYQVRGTEAKCHAPKTDGCNCSNRLLATIIKEQGEGQGLTRQGGAWRW